MTECYKRGRTYINPVTLDKITNINDDSCAIIPIPQGNNEYTTWGQCRLEDNIHFHVPSERDSMLLGFYFDPYDFLTNIYSLYTFNQVINWTIENDHLHFETIKRVHNAAWKVFGSNIENISELVIDFYYDIAKNNWMKDYISSITIEYSFDILADQATQSGLGMDNIADTIILKFFDKNFFVQIIKKYIHTYKDIWRTIESHYKNLKNFTYKCIMKNIRYKLGELGTNSNLSKNFDLDYD